ncbi:MAG: caspase family protein [Prevotella sp.]|nr:caspase family protein [Prevotella sp.]
MKSRISLLVFFLAFSSLTFSQPKVEEIKLTGHLQEKVTIIMLGKEQVITTLPYTFNVLQENIPFTIKFVSPNFDYTDIEVPKYTKRDYRNAWISGDPIDRTYVVSFTKKTSTYYTQTEMPQQSVNPVVQQRVFSDVDVVKLNKDFDNDKTFAVIIANEKYQEVEPVEFAENDGQTFHDYCTNILNIPESNIHFRKNATLNNMLSELDWIQKVCSAFEGKAKIIIYYAGHGIPDETTGSSFILPVDGNGINVKTGLSLSSLYGTLASLPTMSITVFMDACFSGAQRNGNMLASARGVAIKAKPTTLAGNIVVFSAAQGDETAYPYREKNHGLFTYFLLKGLKESNGKMPLGELEDYIRQNVAQQSIIVNSKSQTPSVSYSSSLQDKWRKFELK